MKKILFILTALIFSSFSLSAQWTCETLDPEFDNATKIAYTEMNNRAQLMIGEYMLMEKYENFGSQQLSGPDDLWDLIDIGEYDKEEMEERIADYRDYSKENQFYTQFFYLGNIPIVLEGNFRYYSYDDDYYAVYSFEVSFKLGEIFKKYKSENDFYVSYKYDRKSGIGCYYIEWPSKEFWRDFRAASSVKIRIKHNRDSDYQYYEFNMSGSSKAFNYVTAGHRVVWMEDVAEEYGNYLEDILVKKQVEQLRRIKVREAEEVERQREIEMEEAELQKELASVTPPHKLKFECTERSLHLIYPDFYLYPLSDSVSCGTREDLEYYEEYDTILNVMGLCPCLNGAIEALENIGEDDKYYGNYDLNKYSKSVGWNLDGIHVWRWESDKLVREVVVPFNNISQYDWEERYCAFLNETVAGHFIASGSFEIDTISKYQITWTQNPLKLIILEKNRAKEYTVVDWSAEKEWESGEYRYYRWSYNILSDDDKQYVVTFKREVDEKRALEAGWTLWETNIGQELLFDHWQIPSNIFFRHTTIQDEEDYLEIIK